MMEILNITNMIGYPAIMNAPPGGRLVVPDPVVVPSVLVSVGILGCNPGSIGGIETTTFWELEISEFPAKFVATIT